MQKQDLIEWESVLDVIVVIFQSEGSYLYWFFSCLLVKGILGNVSRLYDHSDTSILSFNNYLFTYSLLQVVKLV